MSCNCNMFVFGLGQSLCHIINLRFAIGSIRTVASFCAEEKVMRVYRDKCAGPERMGIKQGLIEGAGFGVSCFLLFCVYAASFYAGAWLVEAGTTTFPKVFREAAGNHDFPFKVKLVVPPSYVLITQTLDKVIKMYRIQWESDAFNQQSFFKLELLVTC
ncbi:putative Type I protein exporter [Helianthus annuus]|nr:putative Type I protein exporter [Helianthus annuus]